MSYTVKEPRSNYSGPAEVWFDGAKQHDVTVRLTGYIDVSVIETLNAVERMDGAHSWDGYLAGLAERDLLDLAVRRWDLRMPNGETRQAILPNADSYLSGTGTTPFE